MGNYLRSVILPLAIVLLSIVGLTSEYVNAQVSLNTTSISENSAVCGKSSALFDCKTSETTHRLCSYGAQGLSFWSINADKAKSVVSGTLGTDFIFDGYHRYKVVQNAVVFKSNGTSYEFFEHVDEESRPAIRELGVVLSKKGQETKNLYCEGDVVSRLSDLRTLE